MPIPGFARQKPSPHKKASQAPAVPTPQPPAQPQGPATPLSLEQIPAVAPQVSFRSGELTIVARNSSLGAILEQVQTQTGANIDMPGTPTDRVVRQFGPGPPREVLAALLNGSHFNYVLLGSPQSPASLYRVVLLAKSSGSEPPESQSSGGAPVLPQRQGAFSVPTQEADDMNADDSAQEMVEPEQNADEQAAADQNNGQPNSPPTIKTPQQLLQELQRQQQVQQGTQSGPGGPIRQPPNPQQQ